MFGSTGRPAERPAARGPIAVCVLLALAAFAARAPADADRGVLAASGDKLGAAIDGPDDADAFTLELAAGGQLRADVKASRDGDLLPVMRLFAPGGAEQSLDGLVAREGTAKPLLKKLVVPEGGTGVWTLVVASGSGSGSYVAGFKVKTPTKTKVKKLAVAAGQTVVVDVPARTGALLSLSVKNKGDGPLGDVRVLGPGGHLEHGLEDFTPKGTSLALKKAPLGDGFGTYRVEIDGPASGSALVDVSAAVKLPKTAARRLTLAPEARIESVTPAVVRQGGTAVAVTLAGSGFVPGTRTEVTGDGLAVSSVQVAGASSVTLVLDVTADAPYGPRDVTLIPPVLDGEPVTRTAAFTVAAPVPAVLAASPGTLRQGAGETLVEVTGTGFREGGSLSIAGDGLTVGATELVSATRARVTVSAASDAPLGARDITFTQPAEGGGESATGAGMLSVTAPVPTVASVSPVFVRQGDSSQTLTVTGTGFRDGGALSFAGSGLTIGSTTVVDGTTATVSVSAASDASLGDRAVAFTQSALGGGASGGASGVFRVRAPIATVSSISPATLRQGAASQLVTLTGTGFRAGGTVAFEGDGVTVTSPTYVSDTTFRATVTVATSAFLGLHDVTYVQPANGGGEQTTLADALRVDAPVPTLSASTPTFLRQGDDEQGITITGTGFRDGGLLSISGTGLTLAENVVLSDTLAMVVVWVTDDAPVGARDITFTQSAANGGASRTRVGLLTIRYPAPTVTAVSPATVTQGDSSVTLTITGTGFRDGGTIESTGNGLSFSATTVLSATSLQVTVDVADDATLGALGITYIQPEAGGGDDDTLASALQVDAPDPTVTGVAPTTLAQGAASQVVTLTGTGFRSGGSVSFSGSGVTAGQATVVGTTQVTVPVTVAADAVVGARDVTYTQPAAGGGATATASSAVAIEHPVPTISGVSPTTVRQGDSGTLTLTGTGFRSGGTVTTDASGVTLSDPSFQSDTSFTVSYAVDAQATLGAADLTYTQPSNPGGGASVTSSDVYSVVPAGPTLASLAPDRFLPGTSRVAVIATGTNYASGTTFAVGGSGVTVHSTTVDSATQLTLEVSVASDAAIGARSVTITPASGSAASFTDALRVIPADPVVTHFSHGTLSQGASGVAVTVRGGNFRSGDTLAASGSGVTFTSVSVSDDTTITATAAVASNATAGLRSLTVSHGSSDGGGAATLGDAFTVTGATPTVSAINPSKIAVTGSGGPTRTVPVTITGTNLMSGATVAVTKSSGSGVSVVSGSVVVASATTLTCDLSITGAATTGTWDVQVANPGSLGNSGSSGNGVLDVKSASTLTVNRLLSYEPAAHGGERVTLHGGGFATGDVVDFGSRRGYLCQVIDQNTLVVTVPQPAATSATAPTTVSVSVTPTSGSAAALTSAYTYPADDVQLVVQSVFPAQGATGVPQSLRSACVLMTAPLDTSTVTYGGTAGVNVYWFESGSFSVSNGARAFGPQNRWLVFTRTSTSALAINNAGLYVLDIPYAARSIAGNAFVPTRISSTTHDQRTFTVTTTSDTTAPTVTRTPANSATGISTTASVKLVFSEEIDPQYVRSANLTLTQGSTTIPTVVTLESDLKTVYLHPETELAHSTTYTVTVTSSIRDLHGNAFSAASSTFTTGSSTDTTNPTIDAVVVEALPPGMDGSTTYVTGNDSDSSGTPLSSTGSAPFDLLLPRSGFDLVVTYSDAGGAGIDPTTFSAKCSAAVGSSSANAELASNFEVTSTRARWRLGASDTVAAGDNVTFTFSIKDLASNTSSSKVITVDVLALTTSTNGSGSGDLDPFNARDSWVLRTDLDSYATTFATTTSPSNARGATTTQQSDGVPDFAQALELIGLNSGSPTSAAQSVTNGNDTGTNAIMRRLVSERIREIVRERFEIDEDGTRDDGSVDIEFLLAGEQGSLSSLPTYQSAPSGNASTAHNEMSIGGTDGPESSAYSTSGTLGRASKDVRNSRKELDLDDGSSSAPVGIHMMAMMKLRVNSTYGAFSTKVSAKFVAIHGGTPVGEHASDDDVLAGSFDRTTSSNTTHNARYDAIMDAVDTVALYVSSVLAHEIGHSLGLAPNSAPKTGLFGWAHRNNTFTEATSASPNTSSHLDYGAPRNLMAAAVSFEEAIRTGTEFKRFNPLFLAHLRRRVLYDEGR